jgi:hypothetical protein
MVKSLFTFKIALKMANQFLIVPKAMMLFVNKLGWTAQTGAA